jgi:hypothetical protein
LNTSLNGSMSVERHIGHVSPGMPDCRRHAQRLENAETIRNDANTRVRGLANRSEFGNRTWQRHEVEIASTLVQAGLISALLRLRGALADLCGIGPTSRARSAAQSGRAQRIRRTLKSSRASSLHSRFAPLPCRKSKE